MGRDLILPDPYQNQVKDPAKKPKQSHKTFKNDQAIQKAKRDQAKQKWLKRRAKEMQHKPTKAEQLAEEYLATLNIHFETQAVLYGYIPDFLLPRKVILEIDGLIHNTRYRKAHDLIRDDVFRKKGYTVVRISNALILGPNGFDVLKRMLAQAGLKV